MNSSSFPSPSGTRNVTGARYHLYRQARAGNYMLELKTDSAVTAVEYFGMLAPAYDGGAIRLWDESQERLLAEVEWRKTETRLGLSVMRRVDVFHDPVFAEIAYQSRLRNEIREEARQELRMSA